jgi:dienelactone hydrolase
MPDLYTRWMHAWETRLSQRDNNRVVRPFDWGLDWAERWPVTNGAATAADPERFLHDLNQRILARSDDFFAYPTPTDFRLEREGNGTFLRFTSPVATPCAQNNTVHARWFPARGDRALLVLPQWNAGAESHNALCRVLNLLGISCLRLSLPYHDRRMPPKLERADYAVSANLGRTIDAARQAVLDSRSCLDWLETQGARRFAILGTSLGSCYAFITSAHEPRLEVSVFNHASTYFADVVWSGQTTRHVRASLDDHIDLDRLRRAWLVISPKAYLERFARFPKRSLIVYAKYDLTFPPKLSRELIADFRDRGLSCVVSILPCGHYTTGETPFKYLDAWHIARFLDSAF